MLPDFELLNALVSLKSCFAIQIVNNASNIPSGISLSCLSSTAELVINNPTFLTNIKLLPDSLNSERSGDTYSLSGFSFRLTFLPPFMNCSSRSPFINPNQFR